MILVVKADRIICFLPIFGTPLLPTKPNLMEKNKIKDTKIIVEVKPRRNLFLELGGKNIMSIENRTAIEYGT